MSFQIVNAKTCSLTDEEVRMLVEIETHPKVLEWNTGIHLKNQRKMYHLFKRFFEKLPSNKNQIFLVGKLNGRVIGFLGIHRKIKRMKHVGVVGVTIHPDFWI